MSISFKVITDGWDAQPVIAKWLGCTASLNTRVYDLNLLQMAGIYSQSYHINTRYYR